ncbi:methionine gamma-lyase family protein [Oscillospiraceae bacterium PP1C4]
MIEQFFQVDPYITGIARDAQEKCREAFARIDRITEYNACKVLSAFIKNGVSESHFAGSTGYGYGDRGREVLDAVFAQAVGAEDALIRHNFVSGTHALTVALFGVLRPGDRIVSLTGIPYDTLQPVLGIVEGGSGSLKEFGVKYEQLDLLADGTPDFDRIEQAVQGVKVAYMQRSRGYALRESLSIAQIEKIAKLVRRANPDAIIMVDNCYGEFVEEKEPTQVGADLIIGSLIKNPGGAIAKTGGYIAGRADLVELCACRLTAPGVGKEVGCTLGEMRGMFMGLFFAPTVVNAALKTAVFSAALFEQLGFEVFPRCDMPRTDIIQAVKLGTAKGLEAFCQGVQKGAPVDAFVKPEPWDMPGYDSPVIMAAGAFTLGASIELSADGPMREPYAAWLQGGITYPSGKTGVILAAQSLLEAGIITAK